MKSLGLKEEDSKFGLGTTVPVHNAAAHPFKG